MIELIKTPTANVFYELVSECNNKMVLCAPFIKKESVNQILKKKKGSSKLTVITSSNISNFIQKSSDLSAIRQLLENDATVLNYQDLHAKIYLFDNEKVLITSANITYSGMYRNYEYGVLVSEEDTIMNQVEKDFNVMMDNKNAGEYNLNKINDIENSIRNIESHKYRIKEIDGDNTLVIDNIKTLLTNMSTWTRDVFLIINSLPDTAFTLKDLYQHKEELSRKHPNNHFIEEKIRQILQLLRDQGLLKFTELGHYKKLFKIGDLKEDNC